MDDVESTAFSKLKAWIIENGGNFHASVRFSEDAAGSRIVAVDNLAEDSTIVSCPFSLVITPTLARTAVLGIMGDSATTKNDKWTERQWVSTYLALHWIVGSGDSRLAHSKYLDTLPTPEKLRTPLHFTSSELELFKGTNIYGATLDRQRDWKNEWAQCQKVLGEVNSVWSESFTWEKYLTAATYLSSRAFPSSLLSATPSLISSPSTHPVLLPGVDSLNHARGQPVSWVVTCTGVNPDKQTSEAEAKISIILHNRAIKGQELFNNYGPKPNSELILGYGFSLPHNPDDTTVLKVGGIEEKWEIGREARGADGLWKAILSKFVETSDQDPTYEDILDASGMLQEMVESLMGKLPTGNPVRPLEARPDVLAMLHHYLEGQSAILRSLLGFARDREQDAVQMARDEGIELVLADEED